MTYAKLMPLCKRDPMTGCCVFVAQPKTSAPRMWIGGKCMDLARAAVILSGGTIPAGGLAWRTCLNKRCVSLAHLMAGTRADWGAWVRENGHMSGTVARRVTNRNARIKAGTLLSAELAGWVRESSQCGNEVAAVLGVSKTCVSRVRTGRTWAPIELSNYRMAA